MKWLFFSSIVILLSGCGDQAVRAATTVQADANKVFIAWNPETVTDIRQAFDYDDLYCRGTVRQYAPPPKPVPLSIKVLRINQQDVSQQNGIWLKPGSFQLEYQVFKPGQSKAIKQGLLQGKLSRGALYYVQAAYFDYRKVKLEKCIGRYYRLKDNTGITDYPVCDGQAIILDQ